MIPAIADTQIATRGIIRNFMGIKYAPTNKAATTAAVVCTNHAITANAMNTAHLYFLSSITHITPHSIIDRARICRKATKKGLKL